MTVKDQAERGIYIFQLPRRTSIAKTNWHYIDRDGRRAKGRRMAARDKRGRYRIRFRFQVNGASVHRIKWLHFTTEAEGFIAEYQQLAQETAQEEAELLSWTAG